MEVKNTTAMSLDQEHFTILLYGPPKTFKTRFAATFPDPLFIDFDNGMKSASEFNADYITYGPAASEWNRFEKDIQNIFKNFKWKTLVFDSATTMSEVLLRKLVKDGNHEQPTQSEYGLRVKVMSDMISMFAKVKAEANVIFICHEDQLTDAGGGLLKIHPMLPGRLRELAACQFDEVLRSEIARVTRDGVPVPVIKSSSNPLYVRGSRTNIGDLEKPTWACFMSHVKAGMTKTNTTTTTKEEK